MAKTFWMIHGTGTREPTMRHESLHGAKAELKRLARNHPDTEFYLLQAIGVAKKIDVQYEECDGYSDGIPF